MAKASDLRSSRKFRLEMEEDGDLILLRPVGVIDEDVNFSAIVEAVSGRGKPARGIRFDLGSVTRMNSCGVRGWVLFVEQLASFGPIEFCNVSELVVEQANMIPGVLGRRGTPVLSFRAPYKCRDCGREVSRLLAPKEVSWKGDDAQVPVVVCSGCGKRLVFDWLPDEYFAFLKRA